MEQLASLESPWALAPGVGGTASAYREKSQDIDAKVVFSA
jgi:hypothetical protein